MVSSDRSKTVILASAGPALLLAALLLWRWRSTACTFQEASQGSDLYLCRQKILGWELQTALVRVRRAEGWLWSRREVEHWVLVDAGTSDSLLLGSYASSLLTATQRRLAPARRTRGQAGGRLELIILSHVHSVGALPKLMQAFPDAKVVAHEAELQYLVGTPPMSYLNRTTAPFKLRVGESLGLLPSPGPEGLPPDRVLALRGEGGDLADAASYQPAAAGRAKKALRWLPRGMLSFVRAEGHTPGSIAVIHVPSGAMLAGDAVAPAYSWVGRAPGLTMGPSEVPDAVLKAAGKQLVMQEGYCWLLPLHGGNFSAQRAQQLVAGWPDKEALAHRQGQAQEGKEGRAGKGKAGMLQGEKGAGTQGGTGAGGKAGDTHTAAASVAPGKPDIGGTHDTAAAGLGLSPGHTPTHRPRPAAGAASADGSGSSSTADGSAQAHAEL